MKLNLKNITLAAAVAATLVVAPSCERVDYGNMNQNPNQTTSPITSALLTNALSAIGNRTFDAGGVVTIAGLYAQYFSETQYTETSRYAKTTANWDGFYSGVLFDLDNIIKTNTDPATAPIAALNGSNANQISVARILKVYNYWVLTDLWGDMPYSEALKGKGTIPYDTQESIYTNFLKELKEAVAGFDNGVGPKGDILYGGNVAKWKKFGNSLRLLIALRMSKANPTLGKTEFAAALADPGGVISTVDDNAALVYPGGNFLNPFYNYYNVTKRDDYGVSKTILDYMNARGDLRNQIFGTSTVGFPYGLTRDNAVAFANANTNYARLMNTSVATSTSPVPVITAAHIWLARAEAANLNWTADNVNTSYAKGIEASWNEWGIFNPNSLANYLANPDVDLAGGEIPKKIATQQWLAWYPNGMQGWSVWRKTGFPALNPAPGMPTIPRRLNYGPNEPQLNPDNYATAADRYKVGSEANSLFARVWWDKP
ncbi:MAG TPA: SusD/RagB family nutrient-binding outer membrane lipoprotein [Chitinophagaceae bacterium]|nr:SusD/RagB family nutrient-binding outer membrane lipoprotein [Chitinophagaceae bacterium]